MEAHIEHTAGPGSSRAGLWRLGLVALLVAAGIFHLLTLLRTPPPFCDEGWRACRAWSLVTTGRAFSTLDAGIIDRYEGYWTFSPQVDTWLVALSVRAFGPSLFAVRLASLVFGLILLVAIYAIGALTAGPRVGLVAAALVATSRAFLHSAHLGRGDVIAAALGFGAVALYLATPARRADAAKPAGRALSAASRARSWLPSLLAGLAVGLAFEVHANGAIYGPVIVALGLAQGGWRELTSRRFWSMMAGVGAGLVFYAALHILRYPQTYAVLLQIGFGPTHAPPLLSLDPDVWRRSLADTWKLLVTFGRSHVVLAGVAVVAFLARRAPADRKLATLSLVLVAAFVALVRSKHLYYAILLFPAVDLGLAALIDRLLVEAARWQRQGRRRIALGLVLGAALVGGALLATSVRGLAPAREDPMPDFRTTLSSLRQAIPPGRVIMGSQTYWFGLREERYLSWEQLVLFRRTAPGSTLAEAFSALRPDYFLLDGHMRHFIVDDPAQFTGYQQSLGLRRAELDAFLARQARLVAVIKTQKSGDIRVYELEWR